MPQEIPVATSDRHVVEAMNNACDVSTICVISSLEGGTCQEAFYGIHATVWLREERTAVEKSTRIGIQTRVEHHARHLAQPTA